MKRPPNLIIAAFAAIVAFGLIVLVKSILTPKPPPAWLTDEAAGFARARKEHKAVLVDLHASWSIPSDELSNALDELRPIIDRDFVRVRIDVSAVDDNTDNIRTRYGHIPGAVFVEPDGSVLARLTSYPGDRETRDTVEAAASRRRK